MVQTREMPTQKGGVILRYLIAGSVGKNYAFKAYLVWLKQHLH